jgi:hypothetical protein
MRQHHHRWFTRSFDATCGWVLRRSHRAFPAWAPTISSPVWGDGPPNVDVSASHSQLQPRELSESDRNQARVVAGQGQARLWPGRAVRPGQRRVRSWQGFRPGPGVRVRSASSQAGGPGCGPGQGCCQASTRSAERIVTDQDSHQQTVRV